MDSPPGHDISIAGGAILSHPGKSLAGTLARAARASHHGPVRRSAFRMLDPINLGMLTSEVARAVRYLVAGSWSGAGARLRPRQAGNMYGAISAKPVIPVCAGLPVFTSTSQGMAIPNIAVPNWEMPYARISP
jgi:hypothetical protein